MSLKDKLEIGLKPDAPYRPDNLPEHQQADPDCAEGAEPGDEPHQRAARERCDDKGKESEAETTEDERADMQVTHEGGRVR